MVQTLYVEKNTKTCLFTKYWLCLQFGGTKKWTTLEHNGVLFPPEYTQHNIPIIYKGEKVYFN